MRKIILAAMLIFATTILTGCGGDDSTSDKRFSVMLGSNVVSLDPAQATDSASFKVIADCIDGLMQLDSDGKPIPAIAESYEVSEDGKTYTFHLRDAKWSNGDDVTADDFVFAWRRHCQMAQEYSYIFGSTVACIKNADAVIKGENNPNSLGINAENSKTLVVELDAPVPFFLSLMAFPTFYPINEKFYNSLEGGTFGSAHTAFISNGAFILEEYIPGTSNIKLKRNENYWNASQISLDKWQYQVISSSDNALTSFKNGTLDVVNIEGNQIEHVKNDPELSKKLHEFSSGYLYYLSFNQDSKNHHAGALSNVNLRLAISNAIDRESLVTNYVMNGAKATYTAVPVDFAPNLTTGKFFSEEQNRFGEYVSFDIERAKKYLSVAENELNQNKFELNLIYSNEGETVAKVVQAIKSQIENNLQSVIIKLQPMPKAEYLSNITSDNYDLALVDWTPDYNDPMTFLTLWTSEGCEVTEHWNNAEYDKIINDCISGSLAQNYDSRWQAMYEAEKILLENAVIAPLYTDANTILISSNVSGIDFHVAGIDRVFKNVKEER